MFFLAFLDQLTGKPTDEDNILYSVPMVGPYQVKIGIFELEFFEKKNVRKSRIF